MGAMITTYPNEWTLRLPRSRKVTIGRRTLLMGILNLTDDSFSGDGIGACVDCAVAQAHRFLDEGADILDVGAESTRPGSEPVPADQERERVVRTVQALRERFDAIISVDTYKPDVARAAIEAGADILNDVTALQTPGMMQVAAAAGCPVILMHMQGTPENMQQAPHYDNVVAEICTFFDRRMAACVAGGVSRDQIIIDPGFGFGKTVQHNLEILRRLWEFRALGRPLLVGTSRKSTIGKVLDLPVDQRLFGTAATCAVAVHNGADIIRVHDVAVMGQVARMTDAIVRGWVET
jgi:dihydropteroate synthase